MRTLSAPTRHGPLSRETVGRALGGWPIWFHRLGLGRLVGRRYAVVCSVGRRCGHLRRAAVMVLGEDPRSGEIFVVAGTPETHWYRNIAATPATEVWLGSRRFRPEQRLLTPNEIGELLVSIRRDHPREARVQAAFFGWPWPAAEAEVVGIATRLGGVAFRPAPGTRDPIARSDRTSRTQAVG